MKDKIKYRYNRIASFYDMLEWPMEQMVSGWRERLIREAEYTILSGLNIYGRI